MKSLDETIKYNKKIRVAGFDDAPFKHDKNSPVKITGVICSNTRFEGMLWGETRKDGNDATEVISNLLKHSKFHDQTNVVLTDGIAVDGFNIIDLNRLSNTLERPCIAVMRKHPDIKAIENALKNFVDFEKRFDTALCAGKTHKHKAFYFQAGGCTPDTAAKTLEKLTGNGNVPEALRLTHLIGSAVMTGESSNRA